MEWSRISEVARLTQWSPDGCEANGLPTRPHRLLTWQVFWEWTSQTRLVGLVCLLSTLRLYSCPRHQTWAPRSRIYVHIYIHMCVCVSCAWTRAGQGKVVKHGGDWHFPSYCIGDVYVRVLYFQDGGNALGCSGNGPRRTCLLNRIQGIG